MTLNIVSADHGTVLPAGSSALVVDEDGRLSLMLANYSEERSLPTMALLLAAVAIRSDDEDWVEETLAVLDQHM